jgi:hypothetical protein
MNGLMNPLPSPPERVEIQAARPPDFSTDRSNVPRTSAFHSGEKESPALKHHFVRIAIDFTPFFYQYFDTFRQVIETIEGQMRAYP